MEYRSVRSSDHAGRGRLLHAARVGAPRGLPHGLADPPRAVGRPVRRGQARLRGRGPSDRGLRARPDGLRPGRRRGGPRPVRRRRSRPSSCRSTTRGPATAARSSCATRAAGSRPCSSASTPGETAGIHTMTTRGSRSGSPRTSGCGCSGAVRAGGRGDPRRRRWDADHDRAVPPEPQPQPDHDPRARSSRG